MASAPARTSLFDRHVASGGRMVEFAGWEMPVQYGSVIAECKAVRENAGMFDVSHMARLWFRGEGALPLLEWLTTNDVSTLTDNQGHYSLLPNPTGGLVDDIIVYRVNATTFRMVVNAANHAKDWFWMRSQNNYDVEMIDETVGTAMIAVQGPNASATLAKLSPDGSQFADMPFFSMLETTIAGVPCFAPKSGYTGEDGFELICDNEHAVQLWDALLEAGVTPCGLAARDALRVEAGLPLYGHELGDDMSPISAGLGWVISKTKDFVGSGIINAARAAGTPTKLQGIRLHSKRLTMPDMKVYVGGNEVGKISSGVFSPLLDCGIAFAFIDSAIKQGTECEVDIRGKMEPATIVNKRFFKRD